MRGCDRFWVLTVLGQVGGEIERGREKQKASLPLLHIQGEKKKNSAA
jgi:hypothetical protein